MADKRPECRIVIEKAKDGQREVVQVDPRSGREIRTGLKVADNTQAIEKIAKQLAEKHERAGNRVTYKEL